MNSNMDYHNAEVKRGMSYPGGLAVSGYFAVCKCGWRSDVKDASAANDDAIAHDVANNPMDEEGR